MCLFLFQWLISHSIFLIIVCIKYYSRRNEKIAYSYERKQLLYFDLFSFLAGGTAVKRDVCDLRYKNTFWNLNKMPFIRKILLLLRKYFFQPNHAGLLSREWLAVCDLFIGWLAHALELKVKRTALLGALPTLLGPNSTNSACS